MYVPLSSINVGLVVTPCHQAAKGVIDSYDALVDLFESIEHFLKRLDIYTHIPATAAMNEIVIKIMAELLTTVALATKEIKQGNQVGPLSLTYNPTKLIAVKFVKKVFGEKDVEAVLQRLDRLTHDEARTTAVPTLSVVHSLVQGMRAAMDGEQTHSAHTCSLLSILPTRWQSIF